MSEKVFSRLYNIDTITNDATYLYCTNDNSITRINISTNQIIDKWNTTLVPSKYYSPQKIYYYNNRLYSTNNNVLKYINVTNGSTNGVVTVVNTFENNVYGMVSDGTYLYVSDESHIYRFSLSDYSTTQTPFITKTLTGKDYLAYYDNNLYVSSRNTIRKYNLSGQLQTWTLTNLPGPRGIVINLGVLYILNISNNSVSSLLLSSNGTPEVIEGLDTSNASDIIAVNDILYITNNDKNEIISYNINTPGIQGIYIPYSGLLGDPIQNNSGVCKIGSTIYISNYSDGSIYKIDSNGDTTQIFPVLLNNDTFNILGICTDSSFLYVSSYNFIYKLDLSGNELQKYDVGVTPVNMIIKSGIIYFTTTIDTLYSYNISSNTTTNLNTTSPDCLGITNINNKIYICCSNGIFLYNLSNSSYSLFIDMIDTSNITTDGTYLFFTKNGYIYKTDIIGNYTELKNTNMIDGIIFNTDIYYIVKGLVYSLKLKPIINTLNPSTGAPGSTTFIYGVNLINSTSINFGSYNLYNFSIISDNSISVVVPQGVDSMNVFVTNPIGNSDILVYQLPSSYNICFLAGTLVQTDQGKIPIDEININKHTIYKQKILAITKTRNEMDESLVCFEKDSIQKNYPKKQTYITRKHKILFKNQLKHADTFVNGSSIYFVKYNGEILYNVLLERHYTMKVHNLICETLDPQNKVALFYKQKLKEGINSDNIMIHFKKIEIK